MRIDGSIPIQIARAYGIAPKPAPARPAAPAPSGAPVPAVECTDCAKSERISKLIAGRVDGGVDFNTASTLQAPAGPFQLYTRAADKVEAALAVQVGRAIDVSG